MNEDVKLEVIKALAYGENKESIANFAETTIEEIINFESAHEVEIEEHKKELGV